MRDETPGAYSTTRKIAPSPAQSATSRMPPSIASALSTGVCALDHMTVLEWPGRRETMLVVTSSMLSTDRPCESWPVTTRLISSAIPPPFCLPLRDLPLAWIDDRRADLDVQAVSFLRREIVVRLQS